MVDKKRGKKYLVDKVFILKKANYFKTKKIRSKKEILQMLCNQLKADKYPEFPILNFEKQIC